jgi:hypothetical protein
MASGTRFGFSSTFYALNQWGAYKGVADPFKEHILNYYHDTKLFFFLAHIWCVAASTYVGCFYTKSFFFFLSF